MPSKIARSAPPVVTPYAQPPVDSDYQTPLWMQNESFAAQQDRGLMAAAFPLSGVVLPGDFLVAQHAAGANLSVDVASGAAAVWGSDQANQGPYVVRLLATKNVPLAAVPPSGQERRDRIVIHVHDDAVTGSTGLPPWRLEAVQGANAAVGSSVAPATPSSSIPLADVGPILNTTSQITNALIADRRGRATRGVPSLAYVEVTVAQTGFALTTWGDVTGTNVSFYTPGGHRIRQTISVPMTKGSSDPSGQAAVSLWDQANVNEMWRSWVSMVQSQNTTLYNERTVVYAAGTYALKLRIYSFAGFCNTGASPTSPVVLSIEDLGP